MREPQQATHCQLGFHMADLRLETVSKRFAAVSALRQFSLDVASGEFIVLLGPSGAGKTTTLRLIAGLETPDEGRIWINSQDMTAAAPTQRDVAFVFQQYSLYPHMTVYDNLAFPLRSPLRRVSETDIKTKVTEVAQMLRIEDKLNNSATKLSGGQMQRVAIGRALVRSPALYLMDEPLSSLDAKLRNDLRLELKRIQQDLGATMIYVTHDQTEALTLATRVGVLQEGKLVQVGTPRQVYEDPDSSYVASRLGTPRINLIPAAALPNLEVADATASLGIRAEHLRLSSDSKAPGTIARVVRIERLSDQYLTHVTITDTPHELVCASPINPNVLPNQAVQVEATQSFWFDSNGHRLRA
jgi:multiple sugar transport system ATP-binding protein